MKIVNVKFEVYVDGDVLIRAIEWLKKNETYLSCNKIIMEVLP